MVGGKGYRRQYEAAHIERKRPKSPRNHTAGSGFGRFCVSGANRQFGSEKKVLAMPRMPKYLKEEWAFFLDELELSAEDAFSASAPRMGRPNDREEAATDFIRSLLLGGRRLASDCEAKND